MRKPIRPAGYFEAPQGWKQRRGFHYRNLSIFVGFGCCAVVLIIVGAVTIPRDDGSAYTSAHTPDIPASTTDPALTSEARELRTNPLAFFAQPLAAEDACTAPANSKKEWLRSTLDTILSFGTRVAGSWSPGFNNTHHMITRLAQCDPQDTVRPASRRYWSLWHDNSTQSTPLGPRTFSNIIAEMNHPPRAPTGARTYGPKGHLVVSAHFDSMRRTDFEFLGASDSACPVAMMLLMMRELASLAADAAVDAASYDATRPAYTFIFFDGEEALVAWQGTDNTYGSRSLAARYEAENSISDISQLLLLDLLGPPNPTLHNYFAASTGTEYHKLRAIESARINAGSRATLASHRYFPDETAYQSTVSDDHLPWMRRGVPILHLIPVPFPAVWHTAADDGSAIDDSTAFELYTIVTEYVRSFDPAGIVRTRRPGQLQW
jgi:glutaminyl-peptide cyclotransferase